MSALGRRGMGDFLWVSYSTKAALRIMRQNSFFVACLCRPFEVFGFVISL